MCKFCDSFDFGRVGLGFDRGDPYIFHPGHVGDLAPEARFKLCPECGRNLVAPPDGSQMVLRTNADRIRAMTDAEIAQLLCDTGWMMGDLDECRTWLGQTEWDPED